MKCFSFCCAALATWSLSHAVVFGDCYTPGSQAEQSLTRTNIRVPSDATITSCITCAHVSVGSSWDWFCGSTSLSGSDVEANGDCHEGSASSASATVCGPPGNHDCRPAIVHCGSAYATCPDTDWEIVITRGVTYEAVHCNNEYLPAHGYPFGWMTARVHFTAQLGPSGDPITIETSTDWTLTAIMGTPIHAPLISRHFTIGLIDGAAYSVRGYTHAQSVAVPYGFTDNGSGEGTDGDSVNIPGDSDLSILTLTVNFTDALIDVNSDGRFNALDVPALQAKLGSTNATDLGKWDFNFSGAIDAEDVAVLDALVDNGLHSGVFADFDQDGGVDCDDLDGVDAYFGYTFGDANYRVELDKNLDGITDATDRKWVYFTALPGDFTCDGVVDISDLAIFNSAYGSCSGDPTYNEFADFDHSGCVDLVDLALFNSSFGSNCN